MLLSSYTDRVLSPTFTKAEFYYSITTSLGRIIFSSQALTIAILLVSSIHEEVCYPGFTVNASACGLKQSIAEGQSREVHSQSPRPAL